MIEVNLKRDYDESERERKRREFWDKVYYYTTKAYRYVTSYRRKPTQQKEKGYLLSAETLSRFTEVINDLRSQFHEPRYCAAAEDVAIFSNLDAPKKTLDEVVLFAKITKVFEAFKQKTIVSGQDPMIEEAVWKQAKESAVGELKTYFDSVYADQKQKYDESEAKLVETRKGIHGALGELAAIIEKMSQSQRTTDELVDKFVNAYLNNEKKSKRKQRVLLYGGALALIATAGYAAYTKPERDMKIIAQESKAHEELEEKIHTEIRTQLSDSKGKDAEKYAALVRYLKENPEEAEFFEKIAQDLAALYEKKDALVQEIDQYKKLGKIVEDHNEKLRERQKELNKMSEKFVQGNEELGNQAKRIVQIVDGLTAERQALEPIVTLLKDVKPDLEKVNETLGKAQKVVEQGSALEKRVGALEDGKKGAVAPVASPTYTPKEPQGQGKESPASVEPKQKPAFEPTKQGASAEQKDTKELLDQLLQEKKIDFGEYKKRRAAIEKQK